ncbi:MAG: helix-turn-helix domain-containing protein [Lachnospiraceae bacterium]|nr:helix-turn-helix domain-containing protein [Lachnospiraceae bacterium]
MLKPTYSINEVSKMTGLTTRTIRNYLYDGTATASKIDGKWVFSEKEFLAMLENPYIAPAIKAKNHAPVFDFLKADKKPDNELCLVIDRCIADSDFEALVSKVCDLMNDAKNVEFRCEKKEKNLRLIFTGDEEQVRKIYREI